jgi:hypothetical protein
MSPWDTGMRKNGHVLVQRVWFISVPHRLYCAIEHVPAEASRGDDFAQSIDVSVQGKTRRELYDSHVILDERYT